MGRRRLIALALAALAFFALAASGTPLGAAVFDANNADKVDGKHAVGADATVSQRAGKLVATDAGGRLPNGIIAKAPNADRLDGLDAPVFQRRVTGTCTSSQRMRAVGVGGGVTCGVDQKDGGNAQTLQGVDSSGLEKRGIRTVVVRAGDVALENGLGLVATIDALTPEPSASDHWLVLLEPGIYDVSDVEIAGFLPGLAVPPYVDIRGSGQGTVIRCECASDNIVLAATVLLFQNTTLRDVSVVNEVPGGTYAYGIRTVQGASDQSVTVRGVTVDVSGPASVLVGIFTTGGPSVSDVKVRANGGTTTFGLYAEPGAPTVASSTFEAIAGDNSYGIGVTNAALELLWSTATAKSGTVNNDALAVFQGDAVVRSSTLIAAGTGAHAVNDTGGGANIANSQLSVGVAGSPHCVHSYTADTLTALSAACVPPFF